MTTLARVGLAVAVTLMIGGQSEAGVNTHKINAKGAGVATGPLTTVAKIIGGGLLQGTTEATFVPGGIVGTTFHFTGELTFFTKQGATLTVSMAGGTLDLLTGAFMATATVVSGTGRLQNATGTLVFDGLQDLSDGSFIETVTGVITLP